MPKHQSTVTISFLLATSHVVDTTTLFIFAKNEFLQLISLTHLRLLFTIIL